MTFLEFPQRIETQSTELTVSIRSNSACTPPHQQQFRCNPFLTPGLIRSRHGGNQVLQVLRNPGTARAPRLPTPEEAESLTVPPYERVGSDDGEDRSPVDHPREHPRERFWPDCPGGAA